ncbi:MAG: tetratricopeptide repeat protein [Bacteroidota bacterium]
MSKFRYYKIHLFLGFILTFTFFVFYPSINCEFVNWDDSWMLINNPLIRSLSFSNLKKIFSEIYYLNYQPLVFFSYAIEYYFFGLNPKAFHLTNVILHISNVLLVFIFIHSLTYQYRDNLNRSNSPASPYSHSSVALITALLFAIHPMRVESVTWVTERKDVLYTFFFLLSLIQYVKYVKPETLNSKPETQNPKPVTQPHAPCPPPHAPSAHYLLALLFFLLSCLSKGMAVSLSLTLILIDFLLVRKFNIKVILDKIPFFVISLIFGLIAIYAVYSDEQTIIKGIHTNSEKIQLAGYGLLFYLNKLILPFNLSAFYPYPSYQSGFLPVYFWLFPFLVIALTCLVFYSIRFTRKIIFGVGFFIATILFVIQLIQTNSAIVADHYTYLPYIGVFYLAGEAYSYISHLPRLYQSHNKTFIGSGILLFFKYLKYCYVIIIIVIILVFSFLTHNRIKVWQNSIFLWNDVIHKHPNAQIAYFNLGNAYVALQDYSEAIKNLDRAIEINPYYYFSYNNRGNAKHKLKDYQEAIKDYKRAILLNPGFETAYCNKGAVNFDIKNYEEAMSDFNKAIELNPGYSEAYLNRANVKAALQNYHEAIKDFNKTIELSPYNSKAYFMRGNVSVVLKNYKEAITYFDKSIDLDPENAEAYFNRGSSKYSINDLQNPCDDWRKARQLGFSRAEEMIRKYCK